MEAQGAGIQILMSARLALEMGCPIFAVIGLVNTATDKEGRSVPAPGQGILTTARETRGKHASPLLDVAYRQRRMRRELQNMEDDLKEEQVLYEEEARRMTKSGTRDPENIAEFLRERTEMFIRERRRAESAIRSRWTNDFFLNEPTIAPLRGALAVWGLTVDDISVASFHGTGTTANDINESMVTNLQMEHLGRTRGKPLMVVCQKWLTGHPKGAAAAWMTNGLLQAMTTGKIPGNRNADNIDVKLCGFEHLVYPNKTIQTSSINACMLKSFGFGQAGAEILLVNPKYLYATMSMAENSLYAETRTARHGKFVRSYQKVITGKEPLVKIKNRAPYTETQQNQVYLNPRARCVYDPIAKDYVYPDDIVTPEQARSMLHNARAARARASSISRKSDDNEGGETKEEMAVGGMLRSPSTANLRQIDDVIMYSMGKNKSSQDLASMSGAGGAGDAGDVAGGSGSGSESGTDADVDSFSTKPRKLPALSAQRLAVAMREAAEGFHGPAQGIGIDAEDSKTFQGASETFLDRNFTTAERRYVFFLSFFFHWVKCCI